jgi:hypothetical protein
MKFEFNNGSKVLIKVEYRNRKCLVYHPIGFGIASVLDWAGQ